MEGKKEILINSPAEKEGIPQEESKEKIAEISPAEFLPEEFKKMLKSQEASFFIETTDSGKESVFYINNLDWEARWRIWDEEKSGKRFLGIDIETSDISTTADYIQEPEPPEPWQESWEGTTEEDIDNQKFYRDPLEYLSEIYKDEDASRILEKEKRFLELWQTAFSNLKHLYSYLNFYPGQRVEAPAGISVGILQNAINSTKEHGYAGLISVPAYFHITENLERQGFQFESPEARERMEMLRMALRAIDEKRYEEALSEAVKQDLPLKKAYEIANQTALTPQERSWIVLLNSLHNQDLIPPEFNLRKVLLEKLKSEQARREALDRFQRLQDWQAYLEKAERLEFPAAKSQSRMVLDFETERETPRLIQERMDLLIENSIITGDTLNPPESYIGQVVDKKERLGPPYYVIYHMYDKNGVIEKEDGIFAERKNIEHFAEVKKEIEKIRGLRTRVEKVLGSVRNPGPNRPFGWPYEEPSVWNDELHGIEKSTQNVLVITCGTPTEVERVIEYLNKAGYKPGVPEEINLDPRWFVPDIRVLGLSENDYAELAEDSPLKKFLKPAVMYVRKGTNDGYASTIAHHSHRLVAGFKRIPVLIHNAMDEFIRKDEEKLGEYEFVSR